MNKLSFILFLSLIFLSKFELYSQINSQYDSIRNLIGKDIAAITFGYFEFNKDCDYCNVFYKIDFLNSEIKVDSSKKVSDVGVRNYCRPKSFDKLLLNKELSIDILNHFRNMPIQLVNLKPGRTILGCPDCRDGGGMYLEFQWKKRISYLYSEYYGSDSIAIFCKELLLILNNQNKN